jgi:plasmid rolling circle replication initiator protein Rep
MQNTNKTKNSQTENSYEPLIDFKKNGKIRNWDRKKKRLLAVSDACFPDPDLEKYGEKLRNCGTFLEYDACTELLHGKRLVNANFCKCRLCTTCQERRSLVIQSDVSAVTHEHLKRFKTDIPILLTTTVLNEPGENLIKTIDKMMEAWRKLMQLKKVKRAARSWFRSLELTYNLDRDDYHPHFHAILMVPRNYFRRNNGLYITRDEWLKLWQQCMKDDRITQLDIRVFHTRGKKKEAIEAIVGEVAKYATKPSSYILEDENGNHKTSTGIIRNIHFALRNRRLVAYGGVFDKIRREKKIDDAEKDDFVEVDGENASRECLCEKCQKPLVRERYRWNFWFNRYEKIRINQKDTHSFQENEIFSETGASYSGDFSEKEEEEEAASTDFEETDSFVSRDNQEEEDSLKEEIRPKKDKSSQKKIKPKREKVQKSHSKASLIPLRGPP